MQQSANQTTFSAAVDLPVFVVPISLEHAVDLSDGELEVLCSAASLVLRQGGDAVLEVRLAQIACLRAEAERITASGSGSLESLNMRESLELGAVLMLPGRDHLERGYRLLLSTDPGQLGFTDDLSPARLAAALLEFTDYDGARRFHRGAEPALRLDLYPVCEDAPVAKVLLDAGDLAIFLVGCGLEADSHPALLMGMPLTFRDLGADLSFRRGLPAVISALSDHALGLEQSWPTILADIPPLADWRLGLT